MRAAKEREQRLNQVLEMHAANMQQLESGRNAEISTYECAREIHEIIRARHPALFSTLSVFVQVGRGWSAWGWMGRAWWSGTGQIGGTSRNGGISDVGEVVQATDLPCTHCSCRS